MKRVEIEGFLGEPWMMYNCTAAQVLVRSEDQLLLAQTFCWGRKADRLSLVGSAEGGSHALVRLSEQVVQRQGSEERSVEKSDANISRLVNDCQVFVDNN